MMKTTTMINLLKLKHFNIKKVIMKAVKYD